MTVEDTYRYRQALQFERSYQDLPNQIRTKSLHGVTGTFVRNMNRVSALGTFPMILAYLSYTHGKVTTYVQMSKGGFPEDDDEEQKRLFIEQIDAAFDRELGDDSDELDKKIHLGGNKLINWALAHSQEGGKHGVEATLSAMMVESWGAFEALTEDLWVNAVNLSSSKLAYDFIAKTYKQKDKNKGDDDSKRPEPGQTIPLEILHRYKFDLRDKMGYVLEDQKKATFDSLFTSRQHISMPLAQRSRRFLIGIAYPKPR